MTLAAVTNTATAKVAPVASKNNDGGVISSDFETFLVMLTAQMENQDPLNPVESTDFATQLATFSGVEQQVRTNDLLEALLSDAGASGVGALANWVGKEARIDGPARFDGSPIDISLNAAPAADAAVLVVTDQAGREVSRQPVGPTDASAAWVPPASVGSSSGPFTFTLESFASGERIASEAMPYYATVVEARVAGGETEIVTLSGTVAPVAAVSGLRVPD